MGNYSRRLKGIQAKMEENGLDLAVLGAGPDYQYLTGALVEWRRWRDLTNPADTVFVPAVGEPIILAGMSSAKDARRGWVDEVRVLGMFENPAPAVKDIVKELVDEPKKVGVGEYTWGSLTLTVASLCKGASFRSAEGLLDEVRMIKEPGEIDRLRKAAKLTEDVMSRIVGQMNAGETMRGAGLKIETMGRMIGASDVSFPATAGFCRSGGEPTDEVFNYDQGQGLEPGTSIAFDVGFVLDGYCSDWGRSFYYGEPEEHVEASIELICDREGYGEQLRARLPDGTVGHQIGVEVHEDPWLRPENSHELVDGMVFCVEPKLWHRGEYYLRVEDMVLIRNGGAEFLTNYDRERFKL